MTKNEAISQLIIQKVTFTQVLVNKLLSCSQRNGIHIRILFSALCLSEKSFRSFGDAGSIFNDVFSECVKSA